MHAGVGDGSTGPSQRVQAAVAESATWPGEQREGEWTATVDAVNDDYFPLLSLVG